MPAQGLYSSKRLFLRLMVGGLHAGVLCFGRGFAPVKSMPHDRRTVSLDQVLTVLNRKLIKRNLFW